MVACFMNMDWYLEFSERFVDWCWNTFKFTFSARPRLTRPYAPEAWMFIIGNSSDECKMTESLKARGLHKVNYLHCHQGQFILLLLFSLLWLFCLLLLSLLAFFSDVLPAKFKFFWTGWTDQSTLEIELAEECLKGEPVDGLVHHFT